MPLYGSAHDPQRVAALTEDGGDIGGTNDGDLPDIGTVSAAYTQAEVVALRDAIRELAAAHNELLAALKR